MMSKSMVVDSAHNYNRVPQIVLKVLLVVM